MNNQRHLPRTCAVRIGATEDYIPFEQMYGKDIYATKPVDIWRLKDGKFQKVYTAPAGALIGNLYSHAYGIDQPVQFIFYDVYNKPYYIFPDGTNINYKVLVQQGAKTYEQKTEEQKKKDEANTSMFPSLPSIPNPFEGFGDSLEKTITTIAIIGGVVLIGSIILRSTSDKQPSYYPQPYR